MPDRFASFELKVENHCAYTHRGAMSFGTCLPLGQVREGDGFHLEDRCGRKLPLDWRPLLKEADGSVRWAYFSFPVVLRTLEFKHYRLKSGALADYEKLQLSQSDGEIRVRNGELEYVFASDQLLGLKLLSQCGVVLLDGSKSGASMRCGENDIYQVTRPLPLSVKSANSFEIVVQALGELSPSEGDGIHFRLLYTIQLNNPALNVNAYFSNRRRSDETLQLQSLAVTFGLATPVQRSFVQQSATDNLCVSQFHELEGGITITGGRSSEPERLTMPDSAALYTFFRKFDKANFFGRVSPYAGLQLGEGGLAF